jgi:hypothetical protein
MGSRVDVEALRTAGYTVVRDVFNAAELDRFRALLARAHERVRSAADFDSDVRYPNLTMLRGDILSLPELAEVDYVVLDGRVIEIVKQLLGPDIVYHGDSTAQIGEGPRGFHKDNADRGNPQGVDWRGEYGLLRLGIYLQDHSRSSGGLKVRWGSHRHVSHHSGRARNVDTRPGDLVAWYLTTSHSGNAIRVSGVPNLCLHPRIEQLVPTALRVPEAAQRMAFFCTFGRPGPHLDHYIAYQAKRSDVQANWRRCSYGTPHESLLNARGVALRRPPVGTAPSSGSAA